MSSSIISEVITQTDGGTDHRISAHWLEENLPKI